MTRPLVDYAARATALAQPGSITDELRAGFYRMRRGANSVYRPIAIWHGPPLDPETDQPLDRSPRWQALFCGRLIWDHTLIWPVCAGEPIDRAEYDYLLERVAYAQAYDPRDPFGARGGQIDWHTASPPF